MNNRVIKFRAWDKEMKWMRVVCAVDFEEEKVWVRGEVGKKKSTGVTMLLFSEVELMQYTGLKDKNGTPIYEGDKVKYRIGGGASTTHSDGVISWFDYYWGVKKEFGLGSVSDLEVIGNIWESYWKF